MPITLSSHENKNKQKNTLISVFGIFTELSLSRFGSLTHSQCQQAHNQYPSVSTVYLFFFLITKNIFPEAEGPISQSLPMLRAYLKELFWVIFIRHHYKSDNFFLTPPVQMLRYRKCFCSRKSEHLKLPSYQGFGFAPCTSKVSSELLNREMFL